MKIILKKEVANLGEPGDVVEVKPGYALNFLIPKGFAVSALLLPSSSTKKLSVSARTKRRSWLRMLKRSRSRSKRCRSRSLSR